MKGITPGENYYKRQSDEKESVIIIDHVPPDGYAASFLVPGGRQVQGDQTTLARR